MTTVTRRIVPPTAPSQILSPPPQLEEVNSFHGFGLADSFGGLGIDSQQIHNRPTYESRDYLNESEPQQTQLDTTSKNAPVPERPLRGPMFPPRSLHKDAEVHSHQPSAIKGGTTPQSTIKEPVYRPRTPSIASTTPVPQLRTTSRDAGVSQRVFRGPLFPPRDLQKQPDARVPRVDPPPQQTLAHNHGQISSDRLRGNVNQEDADPLLSTKNLELFWKKREERRSGKK